MSSTAQISPQLQAAAGKVPAAVLAALAAVPREAFMPEGYAHEAYSNRPVPLPVGRTLKPIAMTAALVAAAEITPRDRVLHIGTGVGYDAAVLAQLANQVFTVERIPGIGFEAEERLSELGLDNIHCRVADGMMGWPEFAPFDVVVVSATGMELPHGLLKQLRLAGRLIVPVGKPGARRRIVRMVRSEKDRFDEQLVGTVVTSTLLGDILVELGAVSREDVEAALTTAQEAGDRIGEALVARGDVEESDVYRALAMQRGLSFATAEDLLDRFDPALAAEVPRSFLEHYRLIPVQRIGEAVAVATTDPNASTYEIQQGLGVRSAEVYLVSPTDFRRLWSVVELGGHGDGIQLGETASMPESGDQDLLRARSGLFSEAHFVQLFDALMLHAIGARASDIHLEQYQSAVRIRLRVDGELRTFHHIKLTPTELKGVINVLKISANLDIAERRRPQGGRFRRRAGGNSYDLRVQTQPCLHAEHAVIRLLPQDSGLLTIEDLGMPSEIADPYRRLLFSPAGLILVVGPTGSGKSTTIYAGLQILARDDHRKVITVEDPIEYAMNGIQQTQVKPQIGFVFATAMRSFVRQDPDVIIVGEIRDGETALEAVRASQTGHVVLSTLHSNDSVDAVQRLFDLGLHPNSIASELLAVIAQRLAKRVCDRCRAPAKPDREILAELYPDGAPGDFRCYEGKGCERCGGTGTYGRVAVSEFLRANATIREAIARQPAVDTLRRMALEAGLITMRDSAVKLVHDGVIPLSELPRILPAERMADERALGQRSPSHISED